jgi:hypothetical protein
LTPLIGGSKELKDP